MHKFFIATPSVDSPFARGRDLPRPPIRKRARLGLAAGVGLAALGGTAAGQMTLTQDALDREFTLTTFASGFTHQAGLGIGPLGIAYLPDGRVLVTDFETGNASSKIYRLPSHADGQDHTVTPFELVATYTYGAASDIVQIQVGSDWKYYLGNQIGNKVVEIDADGQYVQDIVTITFPTGMAVYPPLAAVGPLTGHIFVTDSSNNIWNVDPQAKTKVLFKPTVGSAADGLCFSVDGSILFVACVNDNVVRSFDTATGTPGWVSPVTPGGPDGIATGLGTLTGYIYVNFNNGAVWEFGIPGGPHAGEVTQLSSGGSRGDFIAVDPNVYSGGSFPSLLLTQTDRILRMDPPGGGFFGPPTSDTAPVQCDTEVATANTFNGDGVNEDLLSAAPILLGDPWSATVTSVNSHGASGPFALSVRASINNGPTFSSPFGGRQSEFLITGTLYAKYAGSHDGSTGNISTSPVPYSCSLVGLPWAAQATIVGGGFGDLTNAVHGIIGTE
jgi:hypothetical protein